MVMQKANNNGMCMGEKCLYGWLGQNGEKYVSRLGVMMLMYVWCDAFGGTRFKEFIFILAHVCGVRVSVGRTLAHRCEYVVRANMQCV